MGGRRSRSRQIGRRRWACEPALRCSRCGQWCVLHSSWSRLRWRVEQVSQSVLMTLVASLQQTELAQRPRRLASRRPRKKNDHAGHLIAIAIACIVVAMLASTCSV